MVNDHSLLRQNHDGGNSWVKGAMTGIYNCSASRVLIDCSHRPPFPLFRYYSTYSLTYPFSMPALIPVDNTLGALLIGTILSSIIYGVTLLQVYSYYSNHCSRDQWPLKCFVAFLTLVDSVNLAFIVYTSYYIGVTNFGDYRSIEFVPWSLPAISLSGIVLDVSVQHFYAYRIYRLRRDSLYLPAAISAISLTEFGLVIVFSTKVLQHLHEPRSLYQGFSIAALSCKGLCDVLITVGMVYTILSNHTQFKRTNNVLNLLAIYAINCGALNLVCAISCVTLLAKYRNALTYTPTFFIMIQLYVCAFMSILNARDKLRETLDGPEGVMVATLTQLNATAGTTVPCDAQDTTDASAQSAIPKSLPPVSVCSDSDMSSSDSVITFDREKYPVPPVSGFFDSESR
ncbi:hypothetical protein EI94DRAFT_1759082 [Lactarius quietus]|nr:hypothetical protein EI94DRAFT_1759082 [Lactarius quietus]